MDRVFHFSDFHIAPSFGKPQNNASFKLLLKSLSGNSKGNNYIVYTGDVIDAEYVSGKPESERNEAEKECYALAKEYFTALQIALGAQEDKVVFCLGNHDIRRGPIVGEKDLCDKDIQHDEKKYEDGFTGFCNFHKDLLHRDFDYRSHLYTVDDYYFFVANSVWREKNDPSDLPSGSGRKKEYPRCISCVNLLKKLEENQDVLEQEAKHEKSFFLVHDPSIAWCENANLKYKWEAVREKIESMFSYRLCGDKHTRGFVDNFHIVGNRLSADSISYGFVEFSDINGKYKQVILDCKQNRWTVLQDSDVLNQTIKISKDYIKKIALSMVFDNYKITSFDERRIVSAVERISKWKHQPDERWNNLNLLFEKIASYQVPSDGPGEKIALDGSIFSKITNDLDSVNASPFRLFVRGEPARGKSVFLSLEYLFLLSSFKDGRFPYVPVLFNCESLVESNDMEKSISLVNSFFDDVRKYFKETGLRVCYILDGIKEYNHYGINIEELLYTNYLSPIDIEQEEANEDIYIIAIDIEEKSDLPATTISEIRKAYRLLYFSEIETEGPRFKQAEELVNQFCKIAHGPIPELVMQNISRLRVPAVDLNLLFHQGKALSDRREPPTICRLYQKYFLKIIKDPIQRNAAKEHAFGVRFLSKRYNATALGNMSLQTYNCLLREKTLAYYLIALHYCEEIISYSRGPKREIPKDSVLNHFFNQEQNRVLRAVFSERKIPKDDILEFIEVAYQNLQSSGKSQFIYLISLVDGLDDVNIEKKARFSNTSPSEEKQFFYDKVANRTIELMDARKDRSTMESYIEMHITNPERRRLNRAVHMLYYADINESEAFAMESARENTVFAGFDIFHSYCTLIKRAKECLSTTIQNGSDWLILLDVFTLCDLLQERLRTPEAKTHAKHTVDERVVASFFYTQKYHTSSLSPKNVLQEVCGLVGEFIPQYKSLSHGLLNIYFSQCLSDFKECLALFSKDDGCLTESKYHPSQTLNSICRLSSVDRSGWKIPECFPNPAEIDIPEEESKVISDKLAQYLRGESLESVMVHTFEMYMIGLLYLPKEKPDEDGFEKYNKQTILNMILIHDIGECETGDVPYFDPKYTVKKKKENEFNQKTFIGGAFSGFADLTNSLKLWDEWLEQKSINSIIAHELDTIQLLYKYYCLKDDPHFSNFTPGRKQELENERSKITTSIGKNILHTIVYKNPKFEDHKKTVASS